MPRAKNVPGPKPKPAPYDLSNSSLIMVMEALAPQDEAGSSTADTSTFTNGSETPDIGPSLSREDAAAAAAEAEDDTEAKPKTLNTKAKGKKAKNTTNATAKAPRPWTGDEYVAVFNWIATKAGGPASFDGAVPDRTGQQTYLAWRQVVKGVCCKALQEKGA